MTTLQDDRRMGMATLALEELVQHAGSRMPDAMDWRQDLRQQGISAFQQRGLPTRRDEEWRQLNLKALEASRFLACAPKNDVAPQALAPYQFSDLDAIQLVFVNGMFSESLSDFEALPEGVLLQTFENADAEGLSLLQEKCGTLTAIADHPFAALNTALFADGVLLRVASGVNVSNPIRIIYISTASDAPYVVAPRLLLSAEPSSQVTVIEDFIGFDAQANYLTTGVAEIFVGANADVRHYMIERESPSAFHFTSKDMRIERDGRLTSHSVMLGASIIRNELSPTLTGSGAGCVLNGVYIGDSDQQFDTHVLMTHAQPHCTSNQYFRGILNDRSQGNFTGRIVVDREAQKTDAVQSSQNLLLSEDAKAHSKPQLEIFADDVRCTHGATIGQLDDNALFYLRARGLSEALARSILVYAFASEGIDLMQLEPIKNLVKQDLLRRLPQAGSLQSVF